MAPGILNCESKLNPIELIWEKKDHIMSLQLVFTKLRQWLGKILQRKDQFLTALGQIKPASIQTYKKQQKLEFREKSKTRFIQMQILGF